MCLWDCVWNFDFFWFCHRSHKCIWPYDLSFDFESTSEPWSGEKPCASFNCWMGTPGGQWLACIDAKKWTKILKMHSKYSMLDHGLKDFWLEDLVLQRWLHLQWIPRPLLRVDGIPTRGGRWISVWNPADEVVAQRNAGMIKGNVLHWKFSTHHGFRRPNVRHGGVMERFL